MTCVSKSQLHHLLYVALIDRRAEGLSAENRLVFLRADLFHKIPLQLDRVDRGDLTPGDMPGWLHTRARGTPMEAWLNLRKQEGMRDGRGERDVAQRDGTHNGEEAL